MIMDFTGKKLLILGGINLACDIVLRAKQMGIYVIVADYNIDSPAKKIADEGVLIDAMNVDALVSFCKDNSVDGVMTGFIDILLKPCMEVCNRLNLPCYLTDSMIELSTNKIVFKETCELYNVPVPHTYLVGDTLTEDILREVKYPVFVKPLDSSGSRGAGVCYNREDLEVRFENAITYSPTNNAIIEDFIQGREFLMNIIAQDGDYRMISMFDRYSCSDRGAAINYANLSKGPSLSIDSYYGVLEDKVINMFRSCGFKDGLFFLQGYSNDGTITFFEMGCRLGGSYYDLESECIGIDPIKLLISYAFTGRMIDNITDLPSTIGNYNCMGVCVNYLLSSSDKEETIYRIDGVNDIMKMSSCIHCEQRHREGDTYKIDKTIDKPILCVYLKVDNLDQLISEVDYMNSVFDVYNKDGQSLLKEKFCPELLKSII